MQVSGPLTKSAGLVGGAEERSYQHLALLGINGDQGRLSFLNAYEIEGKGNLPRPLGGFDRDVARVKETSPTPRDYEHVILTRGRESLDRAPISELSWLEPCQSIHPVLRGAGGELPSELFIREEDSYRSRLAADFSLLQSVSSLFIYQPVERRSGEFLPAHVSFCPPPTSY